MSGSIFENQDELAKNIEESAEAMGINPDKVSMKPRKIYVAKNNCKECYGIGYKDIIYPGEETLNRYPCKCVRIKIL